MASQQDVAKRANVSYMTVSRVVNGCDNVRPETKERVLKAIKELSYYPNAAARALNNKKTYNIGIILPHKEYLLTAPFYVELLFKLEIQLRRNGYSLFLGSMHEEEGSRDYLGLYKEGKVDGLIVLAPSSRDEAFKQLVKENIPFVVILGRSVDMECSYVDVDNFKSVSAIMEYLINLNHMRIGFVSGNIEEINAADRLAGYKNGLEISGIDYEKELVYYGDWSLESGYKAFGHFQNIQNPPTAIFCSNDYMAMGVIKAAHDRNVKIPEDVSIVGYDDLEYSSFITPPLTTMKQPLEEMAVKASEIIVNRIEKKDDGNCKVILEAEFKIRDSCRERL